MRTGALRWALMLALAVIVVLMHHVPAQHDAHHHHPTATHAQAQLVDEHRHDEPGSSGHDALHLCLAVAASFLALLTPRLRRLLSAVTEMPLPAFRRRLERARPPDPLPRRLAALRVLRL